MTEEGLGIVDQLIEARHRAGMTQQRVADLMGVGITHVTDVECGRYLNGPTITWLVRYARAVGLEAICIP